MHGGWLMSYSEASRQDRARTDSGLGTSCHLAAMRNLAAIGA